jgi:hypothetical protein
MDSTFQIGDQEKKNNGLQNSLEKIYDPKVEKHIQILFENIGANQSIYHL